MTEDFIREMIPICEKALVHWEENVALLKKVKENSWSLRITNNFKEVEAHDGLESFGVLNYSSSTCSFCKHVKLHVGDYRFNINTCKMFCPAIRATGQECGGAQSSGPWTKFNGELIKYMDHYSTIDDVIEAAEGVKDWVKETYDYYMTIIRIT